MWRLALWVPCVCVCVKSIPPFTLTWFILHPGWAASHNYLLKKKPNKSNLHKTTYLALCLQPNPQKCSVCWNLFCAWQSHLIDIMAHQGWNCEKILRLLSPFCSSDSLHPQNSIQMLFWPVCPQNISTVWDSAIINFFFFSPLYVSQVCVWLSMRAGGLCQNTSGIKRVTGWCRWTWCVPSSRCWSPWRCPQTPRRPWTVGNKDKDARVILCCFGPRLCQLHSTWFPTVMPPHLCPFQTRRRSQLRTKSTFVESFSIFIWQFHTFTCQRVSNCIVDPNQAWDCFLEVCQCAVRRGSVFVFCRLSPSRCRGPRCRGPRPRRPPPPSSRPSAGWRCVSGDPRRGPLGHPEVGRRWRAGIWPLTPPSGRGEKCSCGQAAVFIFLAWCGISVLDFTSIFKVKPLSVTLLEKAVVSGTVSNWEEERTPLTILSLNQKVFSTVKVLTHDSIVSPLARKKAHFIRILALR